MRICPTKRSVSSHALRAAQAYPLPQALPHMEELPEFKAIEDEEGRKAAFAKFVKRQKAGLTRRPACELPGSSSICAFTGTPARTRT